MAELGVTKGLDDISPLEMVTSRGLTTFKESKTTQVIDQKGQFEIRLDKVILSGRIYMSAVSERLPKLAIWRKEPLCCHFYSDSG